MPDTLPKCRPAPKARFGKAIGGVAQSKVCIGLPDKQESSSLSKVNAFGTFPWDLTGQTLAWGQARLIMSDEI